MTTSAAVDQSATAALVKQKKPAKKAAKAVDLIEQVAHEVENLTEKQAFSEVEQLLEQEGSNDFRLGGVLSVIQTNNWLEHFQSFKDLIEQKFGLHYRKALYLIGNYNGLVEKDIPWEKVKHLGWTKLREIISVLTPENVDHWVKLAEGMTVLQLREAVRASLATSSDDVTEDSDPITSPVTTITFKVHEDQKVTIKEALSEVKEETNTPFDSVALYNLCLGYLGKSVAVAPAAAAAPATANPKDLVKALKDNMSAIGWETVLEAFSEVFPTIDLTVEV